MQKHFLAGLALALLVSSNATAGGCPAHYLGGQMPEIRNAKLAQSTQELCYGVFGVMHSGVRRTPLRAGAVWFVENTSDARAETISIADLEGRIGINLMSALSAPQKEALLRLPNVPRSRK